MSKNTTVNCPKCKEVFKVDDSVYTDIVKQVRDQQFDDDLKNRLATADKEKESALKLKEAELKSAFNQQLSAKDTEINSLKFKSKEELAGELEKKRNIYQTIRSQSCQC